MTAGTPASSPGGTAAPNGAPEPIPRSRRGHPRVRVRLFGETLSRRDPGVHPVQADRRVEVPGPQHRRPARGKRRQRAAAGRQRCHDHAGLARVHGWQLTGIHPRSPAAGTLGPARCHPRFRAQGARGTAADRGRAPAPPAAREPSARSLGVSTAAKPPGTTRSRSFPAARYRGPARTSPATPCTLRRVTASSPCPMRPLSVTTAIPPRPPITARQRAARNGRYKAPQPGPDTRRPQRPSRRHPETSGRSALHRRCGARPQPGRHLVRGAPERPFLFPVPDRTMIIYCAGCPFRGAAAGQDL